MVNLAGTLVAKDAIQAVGVSQFDDMDGNACSKMFRPNRPLRRSGQTDDGNAIGEQRFGEMRADEAGDPGDQRFSTHRFPSRLLADQSNHRNYGVGFGTSLRKRGTASPSACPSGSSSVAESQSKARSSRLNIAASFRAENGRNGCMTDVSALAICRPTLIVVAQAARSVLRCFQGSFSPK